MRRVLLVTLFILGSSVVGGWPTAAPAQTVPEATVAIGVQGGVASPGNPSCPDRFPPLPLVEQSFVVTLSAPAVDPVVVQVSWGGSAVAGVDYTNHPDSVTIAAGATSVTIPAGITQSAAGTTIVLTLGTGSGYTLGTPSTVTADIPIVAVPAILCVPIAPTPPEVAPEFTG